RDQRLRRYSHLVNRAIAEIDQLLRMSQRERRSGSLRGLMAGVGRRRGVAFATCGAHRGEPDAPRPSAVPYSLELPVPIGRRGEPYFHFDMGIGRRSEHYGDAAVVRKIARGRT